jgi:hypothetical protein
LLLTTPVVWVIGNFIISGWRNVEVES